MKNAPDYKANDPRGWGWRSSSRRRAVQLHGEKEVRAMERQMREDLKISTRDIQLNEVTWHVEAKDEIDDPEGHFDFGPSDVEKKATADCVTSIRRAAEDNVWAWCYVKVTGTYKGIVEFEGLGGCNYGSEEEFKNDPYYKDLRTDILANIQKRVSEIVEDAAVLADA